MAKCGAYALMWGPSFDENSMNLVDHIKEMGFDGIEIPLVTSILNGFPRNELKKRLTDTQLTALFCAGLDPKQNVASRKKKERVRGIDHLKKCVDVVKEFDGDILAGVLYGVWGGFSGLPPTDEELERSAECIREVSEYSRKLDIDLAIEPVSRFESYLIATAEEGLEYIKRVGNSNVGLHLDTFQMNIEEKNLPATIKNAGDKLYHFHVCASDRGIPGTGHVDWKGVFSALKEINYKRWLTVESFSPEPGGAGTAAKVWRRLAPTADDIAKGGLELIRSNLT